MGHDELVTVDNVSRYELESTSSEKEENWSENLEQNSSDVNSTSSEVNSTLGVGLDHFIPEPVGTESNLLVAADNEILFPKSMMEFWDSPRQDLIVDRLSECEKQKLLNLAKIQNDGTVDVDLEKDASLVSELLKFQSSEESTTMSASVVSESKKSAPWLQIVMLVVGTRGDVQPFLAMAKKLQDYGHRVRLATHADFDTFVKSAGVDFYPLGGDPRALARYMVRNKGIIPSGPTEISIQRKQLKAIIDSLLPACIEPDLETGIPFRAQAIIANPTACGHTHIAEALGVPLHIFFTMPWTPTYEFSHPLARVPQSAGYWLSYIIVDVLIWWGIRGLINDFRKRKLKLAPIAYFSMYSGSITHLPTGYMWSPHVVPKPTDWGPLVDVVGYCFLNLGSKYQPQEDFVRWIQKGPKPLYFGFGSMPLDDPKRTTDIIVEALKDTGQRGIIDRGWGNLGNSAEVPENVFVLEECPHDWLFPQCSALVHHGGAGTTATGLKAGCPTTIVPFFGDQFFWGDRIYQRGLGPVPIPISELSLENLTNAIKFMLQPEVKSQAMAIAKLIENEDGVTAAVDAFHRHLPPELPLPTPSPVVEDHANPLQWFFLQLAKLCTLPCGSV
ncbi:sterol 3-beta-glucosyltransferase UGT80B1-like isoform X1 [Vigna unguiculata]|uniref:sterol 3-beta-glucosyltransferase UGT80B1-like isoform X1 n=2 Tax=Vigna unguiculata TaxID=3917 RepID=UPI001016FD20|nr:sterol 3-beta-glucosyltransferase UGT80B1-like isoform X1 [Vigna unguiculata]